MALIGFFALAGGMPNGSGNGGTTTTDSNNTTNILSNNEMRLFSPETNVYVNSGNSTQDTSVTGDRNTTIATNPACFAWQGVDGDASNPRLCVSWQDMAQGSPRPQP
jgi:hypothetical protein